jgi:hypothetical protein
MLSLTWANVAMWCYHVRGTVGPGPTACAHCWQLPTSRVTYKLIGSEDGRKQCNAMVASWLNHWKLPASEGRKRRDWIIGCVVTRVLNIILGGETSTESHELLALWTGLFLPFFMSILVCTIVVSLHSLSSMAIYSTRCGRSYWERYNLDGSACRRTVACAQCRSTSANSSLY